MPKTDFERVQDLAQGFISLVPVVILGSGASLVYGIPGMTKLAEHISALHPTVDSPSWNKFIEALPEKGLERALNEVQLPDALANQIVQATREYLLPFETSVLFNTANDASYLALTRLYRHFFRSSHKKIHVVTSNYDRLAEFAADAGDFACSTGFSHGYVRYKTQDLQKGELSICRGKEMVRTVYVWKVHGSFDWFMHDLSRKVLAIPSALSIPASHSPAMITPGVMKYKRAHEEPFRTILTHADNALANARSYLCLGYGFNDDHIQAKLIERCYNSNIPIVIITRTLTDAAKKIIFNDQCTKFLALEQCQNGTRAYFKDKKDGIDLQGIEIWQLNNFLDMVIGEEL